MGLVEVCGKEAGFIGQGGGCPGQLSDGTGWHRLGEVPDHLYATWSQPLLRDQSRSMFTAAAAGAASWSHRLEHWVSARGTICDGRRAKPGWAHLRVVLLVGQIMLRGRRDLRRVHAGLWTVRLAAAAILVGKMAESHVVSLTSSATTDIKWRLVLPLKLQTVLIWNRVSPRVRPDAIFCARFEVCRVLRPAWAWLDRCQLVEALRFACIREFVSCTRWAHV